MKSYILAMAVAQREHGRIFSPGCLFSSVVRETKTTKAILMPRSTTDCHKHPPHDYLMSYISNY